MESLVRPIEIPLTESISGLTSESLLSSSPAESSDERASDPSSAETAASLLDRKELSNLMSLADTIKAQATVLESFMSRTQSCEPSLGVDGSAIDIPPWERDVLKAKSTLLGATRQLQSLVKGPVGILLDIGVSIFRHRDPALLILLGERDLVPAGDSAI